MTITTNDRYQIRDDFAGPGGWDEGLRMLAAAGLPIKSMIGVEFDKAACDTAVAAGHARLHLDVTALDPADWTGLEGYIASPPCQTFSLAGGGAGRAALAHLVEAAKHVAAGMSPKDAIALVSDDTLDERSVLVLEPLRVIRGAQPRWVALEQVPAVLPIWQAYVEVLADLGYTARTESVQAEQYGVPQTRKRAILIAVRNDVMEQAGLTEVPWPTPTHSKFHNRTPSRLDVGVAPWVSMAEALGWGGDELVGFPRRADNDDVVTMDGVDYRARDLRDASRPAQVVTEKARSWSRFGDVVQSKGCVRDADQPAPTVTASMDNGNFRFVADRVAVEAEVTPRVNNQSGTTFDLAWPADRPAPVIAGREIVTMPGANANRFNGSTKSRNDGVRVTVQEAGVLQTFPVDYPWSGTKTKQFQQVGNAVPPLLAAHFLAPLLGL